MYRIYRIIFIATKCANVVMKNNLVYLFTNVLFCVVDI
jgi:hypothetical protein